MKQEAIIPIVIPVIVPENIHAKAPNIHKSMTAFSVRFVLNFHNMIMKLNAVAIPIKSISIYITCLEEGMGFEPMVLA